MYVGHLALALSATRLRRTVPLWALLIASQGPDYLQWVFGLFEEYSRSQLHSHSLPSICAGAAVVAVTYGMRSSDWAGARLLAALYASHLLLDLGTGVKTIWPGTPKIGACLYERPGLDFVFEAAIAMAGWLVYRATVGARRNTTAAWAVVATLVVTQAMLDSAQYLRRIRWPISPDACSAEPND